MQTDLPGIDSIVWQLEANLVSGYSIGNPKAWQALIVHAHQTEAEIASLTWWNVALSVAVVALAAWLFLSRKKTRPTP